MAMRTLAGFFLLFSLLICHGRDILAFGTAGRLDALHLKGFGPLTGDYSFQDILKIAGSLFIPMLIVMSVLWIIILRRQVRKKTTGLNNEISEHKKTMESLRKQKLLLNEMEKVSKTGGWEYDLKTQKVTWTDGLFQITGVSPSDFDTSSYKNSLSFFHPADQEKLDKAFFNTVEKGDPYDFELRIKTYDGTDKWIRLRGLAEFLEGKLTRIYGGASDITDRKEREMELKKLKDELEDQVTERTAELQDKIRSLDKSQKAMLYMVEDLNAITRELKEEREKLEFSNKELEAFTYSVSHDLRAPLRAINGFARFLIEDYSDTIDDEGKRFINTIRYNADKMDQLISDMLDLSRVSRTNIEFNLVELSALVRSVFQEVASEDEQKLFHLTIEDMPPVICDSSLIKQVWQNLIENALKYSSKSQTRKIITGAMENENEIVFYIKDHGAGFDDQYRHKLFGVFQRLHRENEFEGTGVGLAVVKRIIRRHGGRVWAEGKTNEGSTFYFTLPRKELKSDY